MKCKRLFALLLSLCMIASLFVAMPISAATENVVDITVEDASDITWLGADSSATATDADGIGGRDGVIALGNLAYSNNNAAGVVLADSFAFQEGDVLTYSLDVYSDTISNPDIWVRNHGSSLEPFATFYHTATTGTWTPITKTVTYAELVATAGNAIGAGWNTASKYALYVRPRNGQTGTVYVDNFTVTVTRETGEDHEHEYGDWVDNGDGTHTKKCSCTDSVTEPHTWGDGVETVPPTTETEGTMTYTCTTCGATKTEAIEKLPADITTITVGSLTDVNPGDTITVPVSIANNGDDDEWNDNGTGLTGLTLNVKYNPSVLTYKTAVHGGEGLTSLALTKPGSAATQGDLNFVFDSTDPDNTDGTFLNIRFTVATGNWGGDHTIDITVVTAKKNNEVVPTVAVDGTVSITGPAHEHSYGDWEIDGDNHKKTCSVCNDVLTEAHTYDAGVETQAPTCTETGTKTFTCECKASYTEDIEALGHSWDEGVVTKTVTCTEDGVKTYTCTVCGETNEEETKALGHSWGDGVITQAPTTEAAGIKTYTCTVCGETKTEAIDKIVIRGNIIDIEVNDASDITWLNGGTAADANGIGKRDGVIGLGNLANSNGNTAGIKIPDGFAFQEGDILSYSFDVYTSVTNPDVWLRNHGSSLNPFAVFFQENVSTNTWVSITKTFTFEELEAKNAANENSQGSFTDVGNYALYFRPRQSGTLYIDNFKVTVSREGYCAHEEVEWKTIDADTHTGECSNCFKEVTMPHTWNDGVVKTNPTCTEPGVMTYTCTACNTTKDEVIPTDHEWVKDEEKTKAPTCTDDGVDAFTCTKCSETKEEVVAKLNHSWNEGAQTKDPTCTEPGVKTFTCTRCNITYTEDISALGHAFSNWKVEKEATCETTGEESRKCDRCGYVDTKITPTGHKWDEGVIIKEVTCEEDGEKKFTCTVCDETEIEPIKTTGHDLKEETIDSTCTVQGTKVTTCTKCDYRKEEILPFGHEWSNGVTTKPATFAEEGLETVTCRKCGNTEERVIPKLGQNYIEIDSPLDAVNELTWVASNEVKVTKVNRISGRDNVLKVEGLKDSNNNTAGIKLPDGFSFQKGDILTYSVDIYAEGAIKPNIWLRNHKNAGDLNPLTKFLRDKAISANTWTTVEGTVTFDEMVALSLDPKVSDSNGAFETPGNYALYIRPAEEGVTVYLDNFKVAVARAGYCKHENGNWTSYDETTHTGTCSLCGQEETVEHTWVPGEITKPATCTEDGKAPATCVCGAESIAVLPALGHKWDEGKITKEPTYTEEGVKTYTCTVCGETKEEAINKLGQNIIDIDAPLDKADELTWVSTDAVTVTVADEIGGRNSVLKVEGLKNTNENTAGIMLSDGFAFKPGDILTYSFDVYADAAIKPDIWLRNINKDDNYEPFETFYHEAPAGVWTTITKTTTYEEWVASKDNGAGDWTRAGNFAVFFRPRTEATLYLDNFKVAVARPGYCAHEDGVWESTGAETHKGTCSLCGQETIAEHTWVPSEITKAPTCTEDGEAPATCICGAESIAVLPALGHSWNEGVVTKEPSYTEEGIKTFTCTTCNEQKTEAIDKLRGNVIDYDKALDSADELTWIASEAVKVTVVDGIGERNSVLKVEGLKDANDNTAGIKLPDGFAFGEKDIFTFSLDVYAESSITPNIWIRNGSANPFAVLLAQQIEGNKWTTLTKTFTLAELDAKISANSAGSFGTPGNYALYVRPTQNTTVYFDNFTITVSRPGYCEHKDGTWETDGEENHVGTCSVCKQNVTMPHTFVVVPDEGKAPTTEAAGMKVYVCEACGQQKIEVLDKLLAELEPEQPKEPTEQIKFPNNSNENVELDWVGSAVKVTNEDTKFADRGIVQKIEGLKNNNNNIAGIKLASGYTFQPGDELTYKLDIYSEAEIYPDFWLRNGTEKPLVKFFEAEKIPANEWVTIERTFTYEEWTSLGANAVEGDWKLTGTYSLFLRPRTDDDSDNTDNDPEVTVYIDNFSVTLMGEERVTSLSVVDYDTEVAPSSNSAKIAVTFNDYVIDLTDIIDACKVEGVAAENITVEEDPTSRKRVLITVTGLTSSKKYELVLKRGGKFYDDTTIPFETIGEATVEHSEYVQGSDLNYTVTNYTTTTKTIYTVLLHCIGNKVKGSYADSLELTAGQSLPGTINIPATVTPDFANGEYFKLYAWEVVGNVVTALANGQRIDN